MKLSDMFSALAENARTFEKRASEWQDEMSARNDDMMTSARKWQEATMERQEEINKQVRGYFEEAGETARNQFANMQKSWEDHFQKLHAQGEEMRNAAMNMKGGDFANWSEAYAAQMVAFAQKMQDEASNAIAAATEARAKMTSKSKKA